MAIIIRALEKLAAEGMLRLHVEIDRQAMNYQGYVNTDATYSGCETELFFLLSERALAEQGNSTAYHLKLIQLMKRLVSSQPLGLPLVLGGEANGSDGIQWVDCRPFI